MFRYAYSRICRAFLTPRLPLRGMSVFSMVITQMEHFYSRE
jgi:hypothetical protein